MAGNHDLSPSPALAPLPMGLESVIPEDYREPAEIYGAYRRTVQLKDFGNLVPRQACLHRVGYIQVNNTWVAACSGTRSVFLIENCPDLHLLACFDGNITVTMPEGVAHCQGGGAVLLPPGNRESMGHHSLGAISLKPAAVAAAAAAMAGRDYVSLKTLRAIEHFQPQSLNQGPQAQEILGWLRYLDICHADSAPIASRLGLDDVLHRLVACLLDPGLLTTAPEDLGRHRERGGRSSFDELIDYIRANLDQPLRLSDLEARSRYSRRALQYAFREKLGTTPTQWIREQRLARAMEQLEGNPEQRLPVRTVALSCGYRHMGQFSTDFKRRFGVMPSEVRRPPLL